MHTYPLFPSNHSNVNVLKVASFPSFLCGWYSAHSWVPEAIRLVRSLGGVPHNLAFFLSVPPAPLVEFLGKKHWALPPYHPFNLSSTLLVLHPLPSVRTIPVGLLSPGPFPGLWTQSLTSDKAYGQGQDIRAWGLGHQKV